MQICKYDMVSFENKLKQNTSLYEKIEKLLSDKKIGLNCKGQSVSRLYFMITIAATYESSF